ncbi:MAG TPA: hypothetical protein VMB03_02170 [Bryobacteraceae bacterium]|nr:hypothetical protein [Bryobacteraceae bacterium]
MMPSPASLAAPGLWPMLLSIVFAVTMFPAPFVLTVLATLMRRGGTLIVSSRPVGR